MIGFSQDGSSFKTEKHVYSSSSSSSTTSSSSTSSSAAASSSPSGVSGSPAFLPGRTPNHFGSLALGLLDHSPNFSFQAASSLLAWANTKPFWQSSLGSLGPFAKLFFPGSFQHLRPDHLGPSLVQLLPVTIGPGVCPALVLGEHVDGWGVSSCERFWVKTLLDGLVSQL